MNTTPSTSGEGLAAVRAAIIKAVGHDSMCMRPEGFHDHEYRPIRLADVLVAMGARDNVVRLAVSEAGEFLFLDSGKQPAIYWNIHTDDLSQQSEECITFLDTLLCQ